VSHYDAECPTSFDQILESAVILSWVDLLPDHRPGSIHVEYVFGAEGTISTLKLWLSTLRGPCADIADFSAELRPGSTAAFNSKTAARAPICPAIWNSYCATITAGNCLVLEKCALKLQICQVCPPVAPVRLQCFLTESVWPRRNIHSVSISAGSAPIGGLAGAAGFRKRKEVCT
jgi:hypothetical protein